MKSTVTKHVIFIVNLAVIFSDDIVDGWTSDLSVIATSDQMALVTQFSA